jgi:hypothetical protein
MTGLIPVMYSLSQVTGKKLCSTKISSNVFLSMLFICSFDRSFPSKVIASSFTFLGKRSQWPNNLNSGAHLYEKQMKNIAEI